MNIQSNKTKLSLLIVLALFFRLAPLSADGEVYVFQNGVEDHTGVPYTGTGSTFVQNNNPETNWGASGNIVFGRDYKGLLRFDLASLDGIVEGVESATLRLTHRPRNGGAEFPVTIHVLSPDNAGWVPGQGNNTTAGTGEPAAGFLARGGDGDPDVPWASEGNFGMSPGDYDPAPIASFTWYPGDALRHSEIEIPGEVIMNWINNPESNAGLVVRSEVAQPDGWTAATGDFYSDNLDVVTARPELTVVSGEPSDPEPPAPEPFVFQQGVDDHTGEPYTGTNSTFLQNGNPQTNWGVAGNLVFGRDYKTLLRFDLASLEGIVEGVETATLRLTHRPRNGGPEFPVTLHVVSEANAAWIPGQGNNSPAAPGEPAPAFLAKGGTGESDVPWASGSNFGMSPGDYDPEPIASFTWYPGDSLRHSEIEIPGEVIMNWIRNPESNAGLVVRSEVAQPDGWTGNTGDFYSDNLGDPDPATAHIVARPKLTIIPGDPFLSFADWVVAQEVPEGQRGALDTPAGDGVANVIKFALGLPAMAPAAGNLPAPGVVMENGDAYLALTFSHPEGLGGLQLKLEASEDLELWEEVASELDVVEESGEFGRIVRLVDPLAVSERQRRFLRLLIQLD